MVCRFNIANCGCSSSAGRSRGQVGPASVADLASRCHGRPHADQRSDPRSDHGDRWRLPHRTYACAFFAGASRAVCRGGYRSSHIGARGNQCADPVDYQTIAGVLTISQIGYMFLAMGVGAWSAGIFHFMTHAFFKSLLFLAAGVAIQAMNEEHSIFKMGGLRKELPLAFGAFLIAGCSLAGLPLITAGFYSKGLILWETWASPQGSAALWFAGVFGVLLTSLYIFRVIFLVFFGEAKARVLKRPGYKIQIPLVVLAVLSLVGGFVNLPPKLGNVPLFTRLLQTALPPVEQGHFGQLTEMLSEGFITLAFLIGLGLAYMFY